MSFEVVQINDYGATAELIKRLDAVSSNLFNELRTVVNKTTAKSKSLVVKEIVKHYNVTQKKARKAVQVHRMREKGRETLDRIISYKAKTEWPVKYVKHRHTKAGIVAEPLKSGTPVVIPKGFKGPRPGRLAAKLKGHAFKRKGDGPTWVGKGQRGPIEVVKVESPIKVAQLPVVTVPTREQIREEMTKQLTERLRYKTLVAQGAIEGRKV